jgi:hypothetical protein
MGIKKRNSSIVPEAFLNFGFVMIYVLNSFLKSWQSSSYQSVVWISKTFLISITKVGVWNDQETKFKNDLIKFTCKKGNSKSFNFVDLIIINMQKKLI